MLFKKLKKKLWHKPKIFIDGSFRTEIVRYLKENYKLKTINNQIFLII